MALMWEAVGADADVSIALAVAAAAAEYARRGAPARPAAHLEQSVGVAVGGLCWRCGTTRPRVRRTYLLKVRRRNTPLYSTPPCLCSVAASIFKQVDLVRLRCQLQSRTFSLACQAAGVQNRLHNASGSASCSGAKKAVVWAVGKGRVTFHVTHTLPLASPGKPTPAPEPSFSLFFLPFFFLSFLFMSSGTIPYRQDLFPPPERPDHLRVPRVKTRAVFFASGTCTISRTHRAPLDRYC
jgi:hypothetical protein